MIIERSRPFETLEPWIFYINCAHFNITPCITLYISLLNKVHLLIKMQLKRDVACLIHNFVFLRVFKGYIVEQ